MHIESDSNRQQISQQIRSSHDHIKMTNDEDTSSIRSQTVASLSTAGQSTARPGSVADSVASDASARTVVASQASGKQPRDEMLGDRDDQGFTEVSIPF
jgi:hypothetical protein